MAVSRPLVLVLLAVLLSVSTLVAARGAGDTSAESGAAPAAAPVAPALVSPKAAGEDAQKDPPAERGAARTRSDAPVGDRQRATGAGAAKGGRKSRRGDRARPAGPLPAGVPAPVGRALRAKRVVVLFFAHRGADDDATAEAVNGLRGLKGVSIFRSDIDRLARYRGVVGGLGVAQAPAVVIVGSKRKARLVEGFVDPGTLKQLVLDAR